MAMHAFLEGKNEGDIQVNIEFDFKETIHVYGISIG